MIFKLRRPYRETNEPVTGECRGVSDVTTPTSVGIVNVTIAYPQLKFGGER